MVVSVIIPSSEADLPSARRLAKQALEMGARDVHIISGRLHPALARNRGAELAKGDELLFIDADMKIPRIRLSSLEGYRYDLATAYYRGHFMDAPVILAQNLLARMGHPLSFFGGFMYIRRNVFEELGGFRRVPGEDADFAFRAWWRGYKVRAFPIEVWHTRPFRWANAIGPYVDLARGYIWGFS